MKISADESAGLSGVAPINSDLRFRTVFEEAPISIQLLAADGRTIQVNKAWEALWQLADGDGIKDYVLSDAYNVLADPQLQAKGITPFLQRAFSGESVKIPPIYYDPAELGKFGRPRWVKATANPIKDGEGRVLEVILMHEDITDWIDAEKNLRDSEERFRSFVASTAHMVWIADGEGIIVEDSPSWRAFTGQTYEQWSGSGWLDAVHPEDRKRAVQVWRECVAEKRTYDSEYRVKNAAGEYRWTKARGVPLFHSDGSVREWIGTNTDITDSVQNRQMLEETKERLGAALIAGEVATWVWDISKDLLYADRNLANLFGVENGDAEALPVGHYFKGIYAEDRDRAVQTITEQLQSSAPVFRAEYRVVSAGGAVRNVLARGRIERDASGKAVRMPGVILDVTDRLRAEQALRESEERLRLLANTIPQLAWMANPDGWIHWYNDRWYSYTGTTIEQMEGWGWQSVQDPLVLPEVKQRWEATLKNAEPFEMVMPLRGADGKFRRFFTLCQPLRDAAGNIVQWFGTNTDITELEEAQQAVRDSEARLRRGIVAARMAVWDWDLIGGEVKFIANSDAAFGHSWATETEGWQTVHADDRSHLRAAIDKAIAETGHYEMTVRMIRPGDNETIWVDIRGDVEYDASGKAVLVHGVFLDVTDRKRAEEALRVADRRKDEFLAMLAHELRNPLSPISAAAELLTLTTVTEEKLLRTSKIIVRQVEHITKIMDDLLDVSRVTRGLVTLQKEPLDLRDIVRMAVEQVTPLIDERHHSLTLHIAPEREMVLGDKTRLIQVVTNLLSNAAKYTPAHGEIQLAMSVSSNDVELSVKDNGIGLSSELLPHIFELFVQGERSADRAQGGLGLGLALVKNMVALHGGSVLARSEGAGQGSEFIVRLPRWDSGAGQAPSVDIGQSSQPVLESLEILVVDDNVDAAQTLGMLLEAQGHRVWIEYDGKDALRQVEMRMPQVLVLDIGLPDMDGYELARRVRAKAGAESSVLVALSGYGQSEDRERSRLAGFDYHLLKPVDTKRLAAILDEVQQDKRKPGPAN
ncbi:MAG: PAS domain S-box protein [Burkholderiaceae bacterium]